MKVIPQDVRHLSVQNCDKEVIYELVRGSKNLRTLFIFGGEQNTPIEEKFINNICKWLPKLRVMFVHDPIGHSYEFVIPESISLLHHLCYIAFTKKGDGTVTLPSTLTELHHIQVLDFGSDEILEFPSTGLITLRHIICWCRKFRNIGRLVSLKTAPRFIARNEQGCRLEELGGLNKICGTFIISGLANVKSKEEASKACLAAKERLTLLELWCSSEVEAEVLEGLCPPVGLQWLSIHGYEGSMYPDWMLGNKDGVPKDLQKLDFWDCGQLRGPAPQLAEAFAHLTWLMLLGCKWNALPADLKRLESLRELAIGGCRFIRSLPTMPRSLEVFDMGGCDRDKVPSKLGKD